MGWVTVSRVQLPVRENLFRHIASHPGQLSLAIPLWIEAISTSQRAVMLCGWEVKAGMVCEWVAGKTVWSPCYHEPYLSTLAMSSSHNRALYKCPITLTLLLTNICCRSQDLKITKYWHCNMIPIYTIYMPWHHASSIQQCWDRLLTMHRVVSIDCWW